MIFTETDVRAEFRRLDAKCGVSTEDIAIQISQRAVKQLGCFRVKPKGEPRLQITLAAHILHDEALFFQTVRHEYAHALLYLRDPKSKHGHDACWKAACKEVGCIPKATVHLPIQNAKYTLRCRSCGQEYRYLRRSKAVLLVMEGSPRVRCSRCGKATLELQS